MFFEFIDKLYHHFGEKLLLEEENLYVEINTLRRKTLSNPLDTSANEIKKLRSLEKKLESIKKSCEDFRELLAKEEKERKELKEVIKGLKSLSETLSVH